MPHKHKRDKSKDGASSYDLPATTTVHARPLPTTKGKPSKNGPTKKSSADAAAAPGSAGKKTKAKRKKPKNGFDNDDDTPKAFKRLMALKTTGRYPSGLDDGNNANNSKKRKRDAASNNNNNPKGLASTTTKESKPLPSSSAAAAKAKDIPTIRPGEKLSEFSLRVDAALPVSGLTAKGKDPLGLKTRQTKTEKRMQKMYAEWREEEARIQEAREEAREEAEERDEELGLLPADRHILEASATSGKSKKKKKGNAKRRKLIGETSGGPGDLSGNDDDDDDDPWASLSRTRAQRGGLHDVAQAPPQFTAIPREKFKTRNMNGAKVDVADVPNAAGSLRRREELGETRRQVVLEYRQLMERKRAENAGASRG